MPNIVYIATSLDGFIADKNNNIDWLYDVPNPEGSDFGFTAFMDRVDALIMGRNTLDIVLSFGVDWPYSKPVFVLSNTLTKVPEGLDGKVVLVSGELPDIVQSLNQKGFEKLYIDGGKTIQSFLRHDLIDELIITTIPILLGRGIPLFSELSAPLKFKHLSCERLADHMVKNTFIRTR
ncbi:dihydrofolate reductase family protein [Vibrio breoganii]|uniref:dihydrofolate reductase family protein n=1 Tax=Vibrio breoganii TaxID=553239 RepID=UPI000C841242|nr:dihydrofolate reductase family protein [Vibrio breoganii]PMG37987.1 diacylglycerol kinase [Vibrio breoganii]PMG90123.1 diacylglycerol kinase [Vibrio breoganii]PMG93796.1 diacylglycerol kinase [Vibrio breoganii]PMG97665.1 diacylglycerol kinase [Vibrio breoganii]PMJ47288.1 diacylglycerol kinase [Vibrio breoganii]